jgi:outer membrane lipoprotein SlyB
MSRSAAIRRSGWLALSALSIGVILTAATLAAQTGTAQSVTYGAIVSVKPIQIQAQPTKNMAGTGAAVGAVAGACLARPGYGRKVGGAIVGGLAGAAIGAAASQPPPPQPGTELIIKLDSGEEIAIQIPGQQTYLQGDRVRLTTGPNGTKVERVQ